MRIVIREAPMPTIYEYDNWSPLEVSYPIERVNETHACPDIHAE